MGNALRPRSLCLKYHVFNARHARQATLLDAVELGVQEIEFRGRVRAACAKSASVVEVELYSQDVASGVMHRPWCQDVGRDADGHVLMDADNARKSFRGREVRDLEHAREHLFSLWVRGPGVKRPGGRGNVDCLHVEERAASLSGCMLRADVGAERNNTPQVARVDVPFVSVC